MMFERENKQKNKELLSMSVEQFRILLSLGMSVLRNASDRHNRMLSHTHTTQQELSTETTIFEMTLLFSNDML